MQNSAILSFRQQRRIYLESLRSPHLFFAFGTRMSQYD
jgi:hypothetical protein